jgi:hypothetical protein
MKIRLDISDTIEKVSNYAVVRMFRIDDSIGEAPFTLPKDAPQGVLLCIKGVFQW